MSLPALNTAAERAPSRLTLSDLCSVAGAFLRVGVTSFGGPVAHLGYLRSEFVAKRQWIDDERYGELVALCQFLPGPASSQVVFALGMQRAGLVGAIVASLCFTLPAVGLMIAFAHGVSTLGDLGSTKWLHGLKLAAVAVVAQAVWGMGKKLCTDRSRISVCAAAAVGVLTLSGAWAQIAVIACGALVGLCLDERVSDVASKSKVPRASHRGALVTLSVCVLLLGGLPLLAYATESRAIDLFDSFYRSGALVFGGGHVVLPLLRAELVPRGWLTDDQFLAGYGAVQAFPGPMFAFSAYLGSAIGDTSGLVDWKMGLWCAFAIFLPAWLLIASALPFWDRFRTKAWVKAALGGANAAVVGVLVAALYDPVFTEAVHGSLDLALVLVAFVLLEHWKVAPLLVVLGAAVAAELGLAS